MKRRRYGLLILAALAVFGTGMAVPAVAAPTSVVNADLEQATGGVPTCFSQVGWGDHGFSWSLVTSAHSGTVAQSVTVTGYASGDRKLLMTENATCAPAATPGQVYTLSLWYKSTTAATSLTVFRHSAAGWTYWTELKALPAAAAWT